MAAAGDYDVVVIGSGFGGSVAALRLTEKGYRVGVLEAGRRFDEGSYPETSWRVRRFLWAPKLGCFGLQRIHLLRNVMILAGAGVGGGSLVYANTLYEPLPDFFADPQWRDITDWRAELAPFYDQAKRMLGAVTYPKVSPVDELYREVAEDMGVGDTYKQADVGVFFGDPGEEVDDPYFGGAGPRRSGCTHCGECMTGCRHGAKNTLLKNYLYLAEQAGADIHERTSVTRLRPLPDGRWAVDTVRTGAWFARRTARTFTADQVVLAAGALGTQRVLHRSRDEGLLPGLSPRLGELTRTNSEALVGALSLRRPDRDLSQGVAITSSFYPEPRTHVEPVRYGKGSNAMGLLATLQVPPNAKHPTLAWLGRVARRPWLLVAAFWVRGWSQRTSIALVMQSLDNSLTVYTRRGLFGGRRLTSRQGHGAPNPTHLPAAAEVASRLAGKVGGFAGSSWGEVFGVPMTAHILGGCAIGESAERGVIDPYHRVYGHAGLHVVDGAAVSANLGVNPSLTITAQAERAMAFWPNRGAADPRPAPGEAYRRVDHVAPAKPVVPENAPGALRLPIVDVT
jgi:cholesterol oxidase